MTTIETPTTPEQTTTRQVRPPSDPRGSNRSLLSTIVRRQFIAYGILPILLVVLVVGFAVAEPRFISSENILNVSRQVSFLGIITVGQMFYLITKNYDLSNGGTVALASIICATVMTTTSPNDPGLAILYGSLAALTVGLIVGLVNGVLIAVFKISSFMVTLGMGSATPGVALMVAGGVPVVGLPKEFSRNFGTSSVLGIPFPALILLIVVVAGYVLLNWTRLGRQAYAVGGNESAAYQSGVNVRKTLLSMMIIGSVLASLVGVMLTARVSTGEANIGIQFPMQSIIAAVIGGIALGGGEGRISGAFMGALFIVLLSNGMDLIRVQSYVQAILLGALLVLALLVDRLRTRVQLAPTSTRTVITPLR